MLDFKAEPYNDDYSEDNKFYRILFRPSFAVQARELTQLQTILQNQITRNADHVFAQGAMVIPGQISIDNNFQYVKLIPIYNGSVVESFIQNTVGKFITGESNGVKAQIVKVVSATGTGDPTTIYVRYLSSGDNATSKVFADSEIISLDDGTGQFQAVPSAGGGVVSATGTGSAATIQRGVYYVNGFFVLCADPVTGGSQTLILSKYSNTPSYRVGLNVVETTVVPENDETLLDNAQTSYNYAAPGAHRYHIDLILGKKTLDDEDDQNFIQLLTVEQGSIKRIVTKTEYSELEKTFARRTYDESGNYDVRPFTIDVREARNNNRGAWTLSAQTYLTGDVVYYTDPATGNTNYYTAKNGGDSESDNPPDWTSGSQWDGTTPESGIEWEYTENPVYNRGVSLTGSDDQLAIALDPGKAYVQGYEIEKVGTEYVYIDKCRDATHTVQVSQSRIPATVGNYVLVNSIHAAPPVDSFSTVDLYSNFTQEPVASLSGTVTVSASSTAVTGSSTAFTTELTIGSRIYNNSGVYAGTVSSIASDTSLTLSSNGAIAIPGAAAKKDGRGTAAGTKVGTARIRAIEWDNNTIGTDLTQYKVMLFDIKMISGYDFTQNVKSIYYNNTAAGGFLVDFSADIVPVSSKLDGTVTTIYSLNGTVATSGTAGQFTCGNSTLAVDDLITITGTLGGTGTITGYTTGTTYRVSAITGTAPNVTGFTLTTPSNAAIVTTAGTLTGLTYATQSSIVTGAGTNFIADLVAGDYIQLGTHTRRVTVTPTNQQSLIVDRALNVTGSTIIKLTTEIKEPNNESLIYRFPYYAIKNARGSDGNNKITYTVYQKFVKSAGDEPSSGAEVTLSVTTTSGTFASAAETDNYQLINNVTGKTIPIAPEKISVSTGTVNFTLANEYKLKQFTIIAAVNKDSANTNTEKSKTLTYDATLNPEVVVKYTSAAAVSSPIISLGVADVYRIVSIKKATGFAFGSTPSDSDYVDDVMDHYDLDDGQTLTYYGLSSLKLKPSFSPPNAPIRIQFEYFLHGDGDYFTVNSYTNIDYKKIPHFGNTPLRDCIDFRPRIDSTGTAFGSTGSLVPKRGYDVLADFNYYLARTDKIALDFMGNFFNIKGVPSLNPGAPSDPTLGMVLYTISLEPYTFTTAAGSVTVTKHDNKRYTMRDIGKLEKRIDTLEYYTSLSLLEQETQSLEILDPVTNMNRYKNGFVVDNFAGHATGDTKSSEYLCSIDMERNELRPFYTMKNINLVESVSSDASRTSANYKLWGDVITLPLNSHVPLVTQPYGSRLENINPFAIFTFLGNVDINPSSDEWFETDRRPDIIQNEEGSFNAISTLAQKAGVLGTVWNAWQTQWTGVPISAGIRTYVGDKRGVGTVGWQDGLAADTDASTLNELFGDVNSGNGWAHRDVTVETFAFDVGQSRTGVNTQVVAKIDKRQVDDKTLSTAVIPYIRSRNILIQARGLKPSTKFNPFFDRVDIADYVTPATKLTFSGFSGPSGVSDFSTTANVGQNLVSQAARRIDSDTQVCLNRGDVITGVNSGATAVVVGTDKIFDDLGALVTRNMYIVNIKGTFVANETINASPSGASATISSIDTAAVAGDDVITNANGEVQMLFNIPQTDSIRFRTGQKEFVLTDVSTIENNDYTSRGRANYYAQGILETKQATFTATRNGVLVSEQVSENRTIVQTSDRVVSDTGWYDPLAQTFLVKSTGGAFLSKVDIFFATKDANIPVTLEIREVVNGYPGKYVLPFSRVTLKPEQVNLSSTKVDMPDGTQANSYDTPTTFNFPSPVYVQDNQEYCIVLASDSNGYKVWISNMGDKIPGGSNRSISEQPYAGVLFKSQNGSTWTANQDQDLKFTLYRAKFETNVTSAVQFYNDVNPLVYLDKDPFETNIASNAVKVYQNNHGFSTGSNVKIFNSDTTKTYGAAALSTITCETGTATVTATGTTDFEDEIGVGTTGKGTVLRTVGGTIIGVVASVASGGATLTLVANSAVNLLTASSYVILPPVNGIPATEIYKTAAHVVTAVIDSQSYIITTTSNATNKGYTGGNTIYTDCDVVYNAVQPIIQSQVFPDTTANFFMKTTSGKSLNGSESAYVRDTSFTGIIPNNTNLFKTPRLIASETNQQTKLSNNPSAILRCEMSSTNDAISPIIDTHRVSLAAIGNVINSPSETTVNYSGLDEISLITSATNLAFTAPNKIATTSASVNAGSFVAGKKYKINAVGSTNFTLIGASANTSGVIFTATGAGTGSGTAYDLTTRDLLNTLVAGKWMSVTGSAISGNNTQFLVTDVTDDGTNSTVTLSTSAIATSAAGSSVSIINKNHFVDEIASLGSSSHSKYLTKKISLNTAATTLKVKMAVNIPTKSNLQLYHKTSPVGTKNTYSKINYVLATPDSTLPKVAFGTERFQEVEFTVNNLVPFDAFTIKLVMTSTNSSEVPRIKDFRVVACS